MVFRLYDKVFPPISINSIPYVQPSHYKLIIEKTDGDWYTIHVGDRMVRMSNLGNMHSEIKHKIALIMAYLANRQRPEMREGNPYLSNFPEEFDDTGWAFYKDGNLYFCLVVKAELIDYLQGKTDDPGSESKSEGKEDSK